MKVTGKTASKTTDNLSDIALDEKLTICEAGEIKNIGVPLEKVKLEKVKDELTTAIVQCIEKCLDEYMNEHMSEKNFPTLLSLITSKQPVITYRNVFSKLSLMKISYFLQSFGSAEKFHGELVNECRIIRYVNQYFLSVSDRTDFEDNVDYIDYYVEDLKDKLWRYVRLKNYVGLSLEELKEMKIVSNTSGRPVSTLTDERWQDEFVIRKSFITPFDKGVKRLGGNLAREWGGTPTGYEYHGATNWQQYCTFINDVLSNIREGHVDYCFFIYQVMDLARFHYDDLRTKYIKKDECWMVWLDNKLNKNESHLLDGVM